MVSIPTQRSILIIMNPAAGRRRRAYYEAVLRELRALDVKLAIHETTGPGHAETLARLALAERFDVIVAAGGDGTINEVVNGLAGSGRPFAILPLGTANVMANEIGLDTHPASVARVIARGAPRPVYFGRAGGRVFLLMAGVGLDARIVARVSLALKRRVGKLAYAWQTVYELARYRPALFDVAIDGVTHHAAAVVIAKGHFYGGRFICAPQACLERPELHVCLFLKPGRVHAVHYALALLTGRLGRLPEADYRIITTRRLELSGPDGEPTQIDGDIGVPLPATLEVIDEPFMLLQPAKHQAPG